MGQSCSAQLKEEQEKNKILQARVNLYERGVTDQSIHASQTNIGLFNLANEENEECDCGSYGGGVVSIVEAIAIMIISILVLYILYCCCIKFTARRQAKRERSREKRKTLIMREMETRMRRTEGKPSLAIEMGYQPPCERDHLHLPQSHKNSTVNKSTQDEATFE